ncbi:MAG: FHA domain-containing protein [Cyanobacteria bacterium P01_A01_bin.105]
MHQRMPAAQTPTLNQPQAEPASPASVDVSRSGFRTDGLWEALFTNLDYNFDAVYTVIDAVLTAKDRCQVTPLYIQGIVTPSATFLVSNAGNASHMHVTGTDTCWRLGCAPNCAIRIAHPAIDPCQAAIHYGTKAGFTLTDLGSATGLRHNRHRLPNLGRRQLRDGDLIEMGTLRIEFFIDDFSAEPLSHLDTGSGTYF